MRKGYLLAAVLLLSSVWVVAQTSPGSSQPSSPSTTQQNPSSTSPSTTPDQTSPSTSPQTSQQPTPDTSSPSTLPQSDNSANANSDKTTIEGCLSGSAGNFTLTDQSGRTFQLQGDTSKLADHVGHEVRITGSSMAASSGASTSTNPSSTNPSSTNPSSTNPSSTNPSTTESNPSSGNPSAGSMSGSSGNQEVFNVSKVKKISDSCTTSNTPK